MAGRIGGPKVRNGNTWTEARYRSFITSALRGATRRWGPISDVLKKARTSRGFYRCNGCGEEVPASKKVNGRRVKNIHVDHINPAVDPREGFVSWDKFIARLFCEAEDLQALCEDCHKIKTDEEKAIAKARRLANKEEDYE